MSVLAIPTFTNVGYLIHSRRFRTLEADLSGRTAVVTGSTGGLGLETATRLAGMGARVVVVGRSQEKLDQAMAAIPGEAAGHLADLSLFGDIRRLANTLLEDERRIDILVNNVGVLLPERTVTAEGVELTLATNLAGQFLLTNLLLPRLTDSAPARIVNVSSGGMYSARIRPDDLQTAHMEYRGSTAYARTKRGQVILTEMWAERLAGTGVVVHAMHPGWVRTAGVAGSLPGFSRMLGPFLRTPEQGADTMVWLAAAEEPGESSGRFWFDREEAPTHLVEGTRETPAARRLLWEALEEITGWSATDGS